MFLWQRLLLVKEQKAKAMMDEVTDDAPPATQDSATNKTLLIGTAEQKGLRIGVQQTGLATVSAQGRWCPSFFLPVPKLMEGVCLCLVCRGCGPAVGGDRGAAHHSGRAAVADRGL